MIIVITSHTESRLEKSYKAFLYRLFSQRHAIQIHHHRYQKEDSKSLLGARIGATLRFLHLFLITWWGCSPLLIRMRSKLIVNIIWNEFDNTRTPRTPPWNSILHAPHCSIFHVCERVKNLLDDSLIHSRKASQKAFSSLIVKRLIFMIYFSGFSASKQSHSPRRIRCWKQRRWISN